MKLALFFLLMAPSLLHAQELTVAAAADLTYCIPAIDEAFQKAHPGAVVKVSFGSSGNFCQEIQNGAPFDVFLSADMRYPETLQRRGW